MTNTSQLNEIQSLYFHKQYNKILELVENQLKTDPNNNPAQAWKALCLYKMGNLPAAQNIIEQILKTDPHQADTIRIRGLINELESDVEAALSDYNEAIQLNPTFALAYSSRGGVYADTNDYDLAISDFSMAIQLDPNFSFAYHNRGSVYYNIGDYQSAIRDYDIAISLNPNLVMTYCYRGRAHTYTNAYDAALQDFSEAIRLDPNLALAYNERGMLYLAEEKIDAAIQDFNVAIRLNPSFPAAYYNRGRAYDNKGDVETADQDMNQAIHLDPRYAMIHAFRPTSNSSTNEGQNSNFQDNVITNRLNSKNNMLTNEENSPSPKNEQIRKILSERSLSNSNNLKKLQVDDDEIQYCLDQIYGTVKDRIIPNLHYETMIDYWFVLLNWGQKNYLSQNYTGSSFRIHKESSGVGLLALTDKSVWIVNNGNSSKKVLKKSGLLNKTALALTGYLDKSNVEEEDLFFQFPHSAIQSIQQNNNVIILKTDQDTWSITLLEPDDIVYPALSLAYENGIR